MEPIIEVKGLKKYFQTPRGLLHAVDDVTFSIERGKTLGVVGESGCGKSTLGRTIIHLLESTGGQIFLEGKDITNVKGKELKQVREKMQIIFQDPYSSLDPRKSVDATIREPLVVSGRYKKNEIDDATRELMEFVGIDERLRMSYPHELDGGRRQRVGIARALALNPDFVVCDEPVSALDVSVRAQVLNLIQELKKKKHLTYMFISHDLSVVKYISDRIAVMYLGRIVEIAEKNELYNNPQHPYTKALLSAIPIPDVDNKMKREILTGDVPSPLNPPSGCYFHTRCKYATERCKTECPALHDVGNGHMVACHLT